MRQTGSTEWCTRHGVLLNNASQRHSISSAGASKVLQTLWRNMCCEWVTAHHHAERMCDVGCRASGCTLECYGSYMLCLRERAHFKRGSRKWDNMQNVLNFCVPRSLNKSSLNALDNRPTVRARAKHQKECHVWISVLFAYHCAVVYNVPPAKLTLYTKTYMCIYYIWLHCNLICAREWITQM